MEIEEEETETEMTVAQNVGKHIMQSKISNPCIRCGKERIIVKTWNEKVDTYFGTSDIVHTETACPDPACQAIVAQRNADSQRNKEKMDKDRSDRMQRAQAARKKKVVD